MAVAEIAEIGMLFVRCEGGVSHNPAEHVTEDDVAKTIDAFERAVLALADAEDAGGARATDATGVPAALPDGD